MERDGVLSSGYVCEMINNLHAFIMNGDYKK